MVRLRSLWEWWDKARFGSLLHLIGWTVVIAVGSSAAPQDESWLGLPPLRSILVPLGVVYLVMSVVAVIILFLGVKGGDELPENQRRSSLLLLAVFALLVFFGSRISPPDSEEEPEDEPSVVASETEDVTEPLALEDTQVLFLVVALAAGVGLVWWMRRQAESAAEPEREHNAAVLVEQVVGDLADEVEPRRAVLVAYARFEGGLASAGYERAVAETTREHIARWLGAVGPAAGPVDTWPLAELADLYELARFSNREITSNDRLRALGGMRRLLAELERMPARSASTQHGDAPTEQVSRQ